VSALIRHRAAYCAQIGDFLQATPQEVLGQLLLRQQGDVSFGQQQAWLRQVELLRAHLTPWPSGWIAFEYVIPRVGRRADNIVLIDGHVVVLEFKAGADRFDADACRQVTDYALDLKHFHLGSRLVSVSPVLVATAAATPTGSDRPAREGVFDVALVGADGLRSTLQRVVLRPTADMPDPVAWFTAPYRPTPTIIEASQALYQRHDVRDITHSEAGADNLGATTDALSSAIDQARLHNRKVICFVSGVPGAGKTLAGLNLVCQRRARDAHHDERAVFLSGNGPLVHVLQEALARDDVRRSKAAGQTINKTAALRQAVSFIQNIHHFRDEYLVDPNPPDERVVVFDEAQRAWDREQTSKFMRQKRGHEGFDQSEPEFLLGVMDRHIGFSAVVCLVGGGQEINTGEAGLSEWLRALSDRYPNWTVHLSTHLDANEGVSSEVMARLAQRSQPNPALHLAVSLRSFRAESLSAAVAALVDGRMGDAAARLQAIQSRYPIVLTRSLDTAKRWLKTQARGSERVGLLASSGARRLKAIGVRVDVRVDPGDWFLNGPEDVRSSHYLEDVATEFDVQGLELDWAAVIWDADLSWHECGWLARAFRGTRWQAVHDERARRFRLNAYRVLLTRARQGMVWVVPHGDVDDPTRPPAVYDAIWDALRELGLPELP
jgi:hypothetical protein